MGYLLSIIIPTKNRYNYLLPCLETLKLFDEKEVEIVVHDNSDDNKLIIDYLNNNHFSNLKYFYSS